MSRFDLVLYGILLALLVNLIANMIFKYIPTSNYRIDLYVTGILVFGCLLIIELNHQRQSESAKAAALSIQQQQPESKDALTIVDIRQEEHQRLLPNGVRAASYVRTLFTIRNNMAKELLLTGIEIKEVKREYQPFAGVLEIPTADFERAIIIDHDPLCRRLPILFKIPGLRIGQFALLFASNIKGGCLKIWVNVNVVYDQGTARSEALFLSLNNYGYSVRTNERNNVVITP